MCHRTLAIYCFIDDFLKARGHREDCRIEVTDAEIMTIAITAMLSFGGNAREKPTCFAGLNSLEKLSAGKLVSAESAKQVRRI